ncbi:ets [Holotrichia oblita]|uniref:Ets n=1 Tax=Holotrichia oblita TaxID=644536 RepID=A0ACB9SHQ9_HOLOL|nr:ets [Holotrichia oblita]
MPEGRLPRRLDETKTTGKMPRGRPRKTWEEGEIKIGFYCCTVKLQRKMQAAQSVPVRYDNFQWRQPSTPYHNEEHEDSLPKDPRKWTREHVAQWLNFVTEQHGLPKIHSSRFLMNGKALCLMSPGMFLNRVPLGGKLLYKDFQLRLCTALYSQ